MADPKQPNPALRFEPVDDPLGTLALRQLTGRAWVSYGIALHYQAEDDEAAATTEAMSHALQSVSPGFAAAALLRIASDPRLGLTDEQFLYLHERAAELDLSVVEDLTGANGEGTDTCASVSTL
ncbi:hypothetical protein [Streptomyces sp. MMBL 11-1]|uniref:hypothetical protein n=1 Tax=Streptomyces sp. MMBL 11-1 TaxID=3026420 RepID=UPI00235E41F7|nr:hypothetical protein [Streptomyces sp. MMBL 11-1]